MSTVRRFKMLAAAMSAVMVMAMAFTLSCSSGDDDGGGPDDGGGTPSIKKETFTDSRDGKVYKKVKIDKQTWMAENLNYDAEGSRCYENSADSCAKYGRLYDWETAMGGASSSDKVPSGVQGVCPNGWHLPSDAEWTALTDAVGGSSTAGTKLKSTSGWKSIGTYNGNGTDDYGFAALSGGYGGSDGVFYATGSFGIWWNATEYDASASYAWSQFMVNDGGYVNGNYSDKTHLISVRCVQD